MSSKHYRAASALAKWQATIRINIRSGNTNDALVLFHPYKKDSLLSLHTLTLMASTNTPPPPPSDLVEAFVDAAWSLPLSANERIFLMTTLPLVGSAWRSAYMRSSSKEVYIPCASYCDYLFRIMHPDSGAFFNKESAQFIEAMCRSITFAIEQPSAPPQRSASQHPRVGAMADLFSLIESPRFPNLRRISIHYLNVDFVDLFENSRLVELPPQVTALEVTHSFSEDVPPFLVSALRDKHEAQLGLPWRMPNVKHLSLGGVASDYIADMVAVCPNLEALEIDLAPQTDIFIYLPNSIEHLILHTPDGADMSTQLRAPNAVSQRLSLCYPLGHSRWLFLQPCMAYQLVYRPLH